MASVLLPNGAITAAMISMLRRLLLLISLYSGAMLPTSIQGFFLDGTNDYLNFATNAGISGTNLFTVLSVSTRASASGVDVILGQINRCQ